MRTALKSFRLPLDVVKFLERTAKEKSLSQAKVLADFIRHLMEHENQWQKSLKILAQDQEYQNEMVDMAEEYFE
jgi:DUF1680 family protein